MDSFDAEIHLRDTLARHATAAEQKYAELEKYFEQDFQALERIQAARVTIIDAVAYALAFIEIGEQRPDIIPFLYTFDRRHQVVSPFRETLIALKPRKTSEAFHELKALFEKASEFLPRPPEQAGGESHTTAQTS